MFSSNSRFTEVHRRFFGLGLYQPVFFRDTLAPGVPRWFHRIDLLLDGRIKRHQLLLIFQSASDKPLAGDLSTFRSSVAWGYEVIRRPTVSLIFGAALGVDTEWFEAAFDFLTGLNLSFTIAPEKRIRFSTDMRMDTYRNISDLAGEWILWYRFFPTGHRLGDFAGVGTGIKNTSLDFALSGDGRNSGVDGVSHCQQVKTSPPRHCERSEAIQHGRRVHGLLTSAPRLAMTALPVAIFVSALLNLLTVRRFPSRHI